MLLLGTNPSSADAAEKLARDVYQRLVTSGWGSADLGGTWRTRGTAGAFRVTGQFGQMRHAGGGLDLGAEVDVQARDIQVAFAASLGSRPAGGSVWAYGELRRSGAGAYRVKIRLDPLGAVFLSASRVVDGTETPIASEVEVAGLDHRGRTWIRVQGRAVGASPTVLSIRAWDASGTVPQTWPYMAEDASAGLQSAGAAGLGSYVGRGVNNTPMKVRFDAFSARRLDESTVPPPVFVGAGDIASCGWTGDQATANILDEIGGTVFTLGDNVYPNGTAAEFRDCYEPSWGRHRSDTWPVTGNHEYNTGDADGHFNYFGAIAGDPAKGYYSRDLGAWHVIVLNANCGFVSCTTDSAQVRWLRSDLAASNALCTVALWHHPRFSSARNGNTMSVAPFWAALYEFDADLVLNGHVHNYERFAPQTPSGAADPARGIRQFVVGTGGAGLSSFGTVRANSQVRNASTLGVLKLTLHPDRYAWSFVPQAGRTFMDNGTGPCH